MSVVFSHECDLSDYFEHPNIFVRIGARDLTLPSNSAYISEDNNVWQVIGSGYTAFNFTSGKGTLEDVIRQFGEAKATLSPTPEYADAFSRVYLQWAMGELSSDQYYRKCAELDGEPYVHMFYHDSGCPFRIGGRK